MSEQLVIRLGAEADSKIHWLIWSETERDTIASGELRGRPELDQLTDKAESRDVVVLIPGDRVGLHRIEAPAKTRRQMSQALPYLLEEKLADDVEELHFVVVGQDKETVTVAVVSDHLMERWTEWLEETGIECNRWMPDLLALPMPEELQATAVELDGQWLFRTSQYQGVCVDEAWINLALPKLAVDYTVDSVVSHSDIPLIDDTELPPEWLQGELELPMALLAQGAVLSNINLLQGRYERQTQYHLLWEVWRKAAIAAGVAFVLVLANLALQGYKLDQQIEQNRSELHQVYKRVFPDVKRVRDSRISSDFKRAIEKLDGAGGDRDLLVMLKNLTPALSKTKDLKSSGIRYDVKRGEIQLQATGKSFETFEKFKTAAEPLVAEPGALSKKPEGIVGTITIRSAS